MMNTDTKQNFSKVTRIVKEILEIHSKLIQKTGGVANGKERFFYPISRKYNWKR